ncbi:MAG: glycosyltransferase family 2 protein [Alphaproteobacteria bacterium]|nr:glycosyltransferase family 2 protein [Alphaproteobacteria bacterium]
MIETFADAAPPPPSLRLAPAPRVWRSVTLIVCTRRRPHGLIRAVRSAFAQRGAGLALQVVAVDADPAGSALPLMRALEAEAPCPFDWTHAPCPGGWAQARSAGLAKATGELVAFLDDVHEAAPGWLAALAAALRADAADAAFGPIEARLPEGVLLARGLIAALTARAAPSGRGPGADLLNLANALFVRERIFPGRAPFVATAAVVPEAAEAEALLARAQASGARFVWAEDARLTTHVPFENASLRAAAARAYAEGGRRRVALIAAGADAAALASLRRAAAARTLALAPATLLAWLVLSTRRDMLLARLCRSAGLAFAPTDPPSPRRDKSASAPLWGGGRRLARVPAL